MNDISTKNNDELLTTFTIENYIDSGISIKGAIFDAGYIKECNERRKIEESGISDLCNFKI